MWHRVIEQLRDRGTGRSARSADVPAAGDRPAEWDVAGDAGLQAVEFVYRTMRIDEEWSIREPRGFTWWGHHLAQRVWAEPARRSEGFHVYRVHAETALLRNIPAQKNLAERLAVLNQVASLSACVWDPGGRRLALRCGVGVHAENVAWLREILAAAVAIQAADAHRKAGLATVLGGEPDGSSHPRNGPRREPDDLLRVIEMFRATGQGPSPFPAAEFASLADTLREHGIRAFGGDAERPELTAEFPFSDDLPAIATGRAGTALLLASAEERHPQLGSGVQLQLILPDPPAGGSRNLGDLAAIAHELNRAELSEGPASQFLGAWCAHARNPVLGISFVTFLPAGLYAPGLLETFVLSTGLRARWAKRYLDGRR